MSPTKIHLMTTLGKRLGSQLPCRGCLGPLGSGSEAGLCGGCWAGLRPLSESRCPRCALDHPLESDCPDPVRWTCGDALWDYHAGRPALGALVLPGIKSGELGWRKVILARALDAPLPAFAGEAALVTAAPTAFHRRLLRGFDLAEDAARMFARRLGLPFHRTLKRDWRVRRQTGRGESARRRLPGSAIGLRPAAPIHERTVLLIDDVWTTGTTLLRCAQALQAGGAGEVRVLTLFRST